MQIDGNDYDLSKFANEITKNEVTKGDKLLVGIFDYLDNLDGVADGKLSAKNLQTIFSKIQSMDNDNGVADNILSDNEIEKAGKKLKFAKEDLKTFIVNLLSINTKKVQVHNESVQYSTEGDKYNFKLGKKLNGIRTIDTDSISVKQQEDGAQILLERLRAIKVPTSNGQNNENMSSELLINGAFEQGNRGDCYYLATINAIKNSQDGQKILNKTVKKNPDKSYTITLPGAVLLKKSLEAKGFGDKCEVTGVYNITPAAVEKLKKQAGRGYSSGSLQVMLLEAALESYRAELAITNKNLEGLNASWNEHTAEGSGAKDENDYLNGGQMWDAGFLLTGEKADVYEPVGKIENQKLYKKGEYGFVTREQMEKECAGKSISLPTYAVQPGLSEVENISRSASYLDELLSRVSGNEGKYSITFTVQCEEDGDDGVTAAGDHHAITVLRVTRTTVYILNPWLKDAKGEAVIEPIPINDFKNMCVTLVVQNMDLEKINKTYEEIQSPETEQQSQANKQKDLVEILKSKMKY